MSELPRGWVQVTFEDVAEINPRKSVDLEPSEIVTFVPMAAVSEVSGTIIEGVPRPLHEVNRGYTQFADGDVIFAKITPSMENGKSAVANELENGIGFGSTEFHVLRSYGAVMPEYLWRFVRQKVFRENAQKVMSGAVGQQRVPADYLRAHPLPLPPIAEQRRIVAKIDSLTRRIARARTDLNRITELVEQYKSQLIELGCAGKLTDEWRTSRGLSKPTEMRLGDVAQSFNYGTSSKSSPEGDVPVLRMGNIQNGRLDWADLVYTSDRKEIEKYRLRDGDVLFNRTNSPELVGKTAVFKGEREAIFAGYLIRVECGARLLPDYLSYCLNSPSGRRYSWEVKSDGVSQSNISAKKLANFKFLLPEVEEQKEVINRIETAFAWLDGIVADCEAATKLLSNLDAAILHKAFSGKLVPQDGNDEPAPRLLQRVKAEWEAARENRKRRHRSPRIPISPRRKPTMANLSEVLSSRDGWMPASQAAQELGIGNGSTSKAVEEFYSDLRLRVLDGSVEVERRGDEDWLRLRPSKVD